MRALLLLVLTSLSIHHIAHAQEKGPFFTGENDRDYLKNYQAPGFKFRGLTATLNSNGSGRTTDTDNHQALNADGELYYFQVSNQKRYQGGLSAISQNSFSFRNDNAIVTDNFFSFNSYSMHNRFYFKKEWFWGFHDQSSLRIFSEPTPGATLAIRPAFSIGHGRLEPVGYGRLAMDVERLLGNGNRLSPGFTVEGRTVLSNKIAQIQNKRYYDIRLGRIYQLQSIDSVLAGMNLVTDTDIVYYSLLQDAFLYSNYVNRYSGIRHELGVSQGLVFGSASPDEMMTYGFYNFSYYLPQSYAIQHNFTASIIGGLRDGSTPGMSDTPAWLDAAYTFGLYPTTRTYLAFTTQGGIYLNGSTTGYVAGTSFDAYYYISPRFRFEVDAGVRYGENYDAHGFNHIGVLNLPRMTEEINYAFNLGLLYYIF